MLIKNKYPSIPISVRALLFRMFPGFARSSFRYDQYRDEDSEAKVPAGKKTKVFAVNSWSSATFFHHKTRIEHPGMEAGTLWLEAVD